MHRSVNATRWFSRASTLGIVVTLGIALGLSLTVAPAVHGQAGLSTGSIQGTILDPNGASVASAKVTITNKGTGAKLSPAVTSAGEYNSGPLSPGDYLVRVEAPGFRAVERTVTVQVGNITDRKSTRLNSSHLVI